MPLWYAINYIVQTRSLRSPLLVSLVGPRREIVMMWGIRKKAYLRTCLFEIWTLSTKKIKVGLFGFRFSSSGIEDHNFRKISNPQKSRAHKF